MRLLLLAVVVAMLAGLLAACQEPPPRAPEECKVTTDPEACRKAFERR